LCIFAATSVTNINVGFKTTPSDLLIAIKGLFFHSMTNNVSLPTSLSKGKTVHLIPYPKGTSTRRGEMTPVGIS